MKRVWTIFLLVGAVRAADVTLRMTEQTIPVRYAAMREVSRRFAGIGVRLERARATPTPLDSVLIEVHYAVARSIGAVLALLSPSALPRSGRCPVKMPNVGVVVRNLSTAPPDLVQTAEAACQQIYSAACIRITWINSVNDVNWEGPDIVLRAVILPQAPHSRAPAAFGTALRERQELLLYQDRIVRFGRIVDLPAHLMLSVALVHEMGHLLLDSDDHTPSGIMRAEWDQDALNGIRRAQFHFTSDEIRRMKANIQKRSDPKAKITPSIGPDQTVAPVPETWRPIEKHPRRDRPSGT